MKGVFFLSFSNHVFIDKNKASTLNALRGPVRGGGTIFVMINDAH